MNDVQLRDMAERLGRLRARLDGYEANKNTDSQAARVLLLEASTIACDIVSDDSIVAALVEDADLLASRARDAPDDVREVLEEAHFEHFLGLERDVLREAGVDDRSSEWLIKQCRSARVAAGSHELGGEQLRDALGRVSGAVCAQRQALEKEVRQAAGRQRVVRRLRGALTVIGGSLVVGANASVFAVSAGLSTAGTAVSGAVGLGIVGKGLSQTLSE